MLSTEHGVHLPLVIYSVSKPIIRHDFCQIQTNTFSGLSPQMQTIMLEEFLVECAPHPCQCLGSPCDYPLLPSSAPNGMKINTHYYPGLTLTQQVRLHGAWKCSQTFLSDIYPISEPIDTPVIADFLFHGLTEAVYSANSSAVSPHFIAVSSST